MEADEHRRLRYANEKLGQAVASLALGTGNLRERLPSAYGYVLRLLPFDNLPAPISERLEELNRKLTRVPATGNEGTLIAMVRTLGELEVVDAAREIVELAALVNDEYRASREALHRPRRSRRR